MCVINIESAEDSELARMSLASSARFFEVSFGSGLTPSSEARCRNDVVVKVTKGLVGCGNCTLCTASVTERVEIVASCMTPLAVNKYVAPVFFGLYFLHASQAKIYHEKYGEFGVFF